VEEFSDFLQETMQFMVKNARSSTDLFLATGRKWDVNYKIYSELLRESEYAAWLYIFGFVPNHFTIYINPLNHFDSLVEVNQVLKEYGYKVNSSGGEVKGSPALGLEQSSTLAYKKKLNLRILLQLRKFPLVTMSLSKDTIRLMDLLWIQPTGFLKVQMLSTCPMQKGNFVWSIGF
tara:strand:+ start:986 stop:1513 length:528 start_codon:yes stop_codon:yes gene_type:complete